MIMRLPHTFILSCSAALAFGFLPPAAGQTAASVDRNEEEPVPLSLIHISEPTRP